MISRISILLFSPLYFHVCTSSAYFFLERLQRYICFILGFFTQHAYPPQSEKLISRRKEESALA